jgi:hypothetical protein
MFVRILLHVCTATSMRSNESNGPQMVPDGPSVVERRCNASPPTRGTATLHPPSKPEVCCPDLWFLGEGAHQTSVVRECSLPWMVAPLSELVTGF